jgi:hypothetical protein
VVTRGRRESLQSVAMASVAGLVVGCSSPPSGPPAGAIQGILPGLGEGGSGGDFGSGGTSAIPEIQPPGQGLPVAPVTEQQVPACAEGTRQCGALGVPELCVGGQFLAQAPCALSLRCVDGACLGCEGTADAGDLFCENVDAGAPPPCVGSECQPLPPPLPRPRPNAQPVRLSLTDRLPEPGTLIGADGLTVEVLDGRAGVRSDAAIAPGSGIFYFEGERFGRVVSLFGFGVVTASFDLNESPGEDARSLGVDTRGDIAFNGTTIGTFDAELTHYGFVIDYRGVSPIVSVIVDQSVVVTQALLEVTEPVYAFAGGRRLQVGPQARINTGNDTENVPFFYDPVAALAQSGLSSAGLVLGFTHSFAAPPNAPPELRVTGARSIALGTAITLRVEASDGEDGSLTEKVEWSDLSTTYAERDRATGAQWAFTPRSLGIHPIEVRVTDSSGLSAISVVDVSVTGTLPTAASVRLTPDDRGGVGVELSADGLSAHFTAPGKYGIRANQGLLGGFQYFEMHRLGGALNQGGGIVVEEGDLAPYSPFSVPPSCSVNHYASVWCDLISVADYDTAATDYYGVAVDYRGRSPRLYVITQGASGGEVAYSADLDEITVPVYPFVYGNPISPDGSFDVSVNFGATAFHYQPAAVLQAAGFDASGLQVGWGAR